MSGLNPWALGWLVIVTWSYSAPLASFPTGSDSELAIVVGVSLVVSLMWAWKWEDPMKHKLLYEFRSIAQEPVPEPNDPRFKRWQINERLPRPVQEELVRRTLRRNRPWR